MDTRILAERALRREALAIPALRRAIRESEDPEPIHDLRVNIRRIRTALRMFRPLLRSNLLDQDSALHQLFGLLGRVRDHDIAIAALRESKHDGAAELIHELGQRRADARRLLLNALDGDTLDRFIRSARRPAMNGDKVLNGADVIKDIRRKAKQSIRRLNRSWTPSEEHRLRRRLKRLRYAVEFFEPSAGKPAQEYIDELKQLQDLIGAEMDRITMASLLSTIDVRHGPATELAQHTIQGLNAEIGVHRSDLDHANRTIGGKKWRRLMDVLEPSTGEP